MNPIAVLTVLVMSRLCAAAELAEQHQPEPVEEPVFGIGFSLENVIISFAPPGGYAEGLATIEGDEAYQDLMLSPWSSATWHMTLRCHHGATSIVATQ